MLSFWDLTAKKYASQVTCESQFLERKLQALQVATTENTTKFKVQGSF